jgi:RNA polymerase sigma-70 factor (ECF subfamily)
MAVTLDRAAVERLYRTHGHVVLRRARLLLGNEADAREALQEVFASLLRSPGELRSRRSATAWLYGATTHLCLNLLRDRRTASRLAERHAEAPSESGARADALAQVRRLLALLPDEVGAALVYHHLDGMTYDEVAEQLGCSRRKVGYLLERAQCAILELDRVEETA